MSESRYPEFIEWLRGEALPGVWSRGVQFSRAVQSFEVATAKASEIKIKIKTPERGVPFEVTLWPVDHDAHCNCGSEVEPCAHVVACGLWADRQDIQGQTAKIEWIRTGEALAIRFASTQLSGNELALQRFFSKSSRTASDWANELQRLADFGKQSWKDAPSGSPAFLEVRARPQAAPNQRLKVSFKSPPGSNAQLWTLRVLNSESLESKKSEPAPPGLQLQLESESWVLSPKPVQVQWTERTLSEDEMILFLLEEWPVVEPGFVNAAEVRQEFPRVCRGEPQLEFTSQVQMTTNPQTPPDVWVQARVVSLPGEVVFEGGPDAPVLIQRSIEKERELHQKLRHQYGMTLAQPLKVEAADWPLVRKRFLDQTSVLETFQEALVGWCSESTGLMTEEIDLSQLTDISLIEQLLQAKDAAERKLLGLKLRPLILKPDRKAHEDRVQELRAPEKVSKHLWQQLRTYQKEGVIWLSEAKRQGRGAILADDMGLGKTLQALAILERRALVIVPTSLLYNWQQEFKKFRPELSVCTYHGAKRKWDSYADVVLTTYGTVRSDPARFYETGDYAWTTLILDEAHQIRNSKTITSETVLELPAPYRFALTGTPIQNRVEDLDTLLRFVSPRRPIARSMLATALLRRTKSEVLQELPEKVRVEHHLEMPAQERSFYRQVFAAARDDIVARLSLREGSPLQVFEVLLRSREVCDHVGLVDRAHWNSSSTKLEKVMEMAQELIEAGHSVLVFSQWTRFLDRIEQELKHELIEYSRLDGSTTNREQVIAGFQQSAKPQVFLLSLQAGGVGLNLTKADHVIFCDPWWNPFVEFQAEDRVHRIGQTRSVTIHRLLIADSIELKIRELQKRKEGLASELIQSGSSPGAPALTWDDLEWLVGE